MGGNIDIRLIKIIESAGVVRIIRGVRVVESLGAIKPSKSPKVLELQIVDHRQKNTEFPKKLQSLGGSFNVKVVEVVRPVKFAKAMDFVKPLNYIIINIGGFSIKES